MADTYSNLDYKFKALELKIARYIALQLWKYREVTLGAVVDISPKFMVCISLGLVLRKLSLRNVGL